MRPPTRIPAPALRRPGRCIRSLILALALLPAGAVAQTAEPADAPAAMLALRYDPAIDPAGWWVSEKLDGVRASWDGSVLRFRSGRALPAPAWFLAALPPVALDGELWLGRRRFDELSGLLRREDPADPLWREVRYMLFELPGAAGDFDTRLARLRSLAEAADAPWVQAIPQQRIPDRAALQRLLDEVLAGGGEGLMLHRADALWQPGRSEALRKLTPWLDAEARVVGYLPGKGRLQGRVGALQVERADGRRFRIGSGLSDALRANPPALGALVTYRYRELTPAGLPRFPRYLRERTLP
ncbi:MAG: DNA ligase [Alphaproteobacteria bacterium ADurb.BinA305]|nr:MAG: DNA ligase [Alphaproteobacteria bacterium ADurb.BinA305]